MHPVERKLVHICGFPSSGTDLLSNFISSHPDICIRGEFPMLPKLAERFGPTVPLDQVKDVAEALRSGDVYGNFVDADPASIDWGGNEVPVAGIYAALLTHRNVVWCGNKTPQNTENLPLLLKIFPDTRVIFIVRDPRDVCVSWRKKWGKDARLCAAKWQRRMQIGLDVMARMPADRVLRLRFEDLLSEPAEIGDRISDFLGVPRSENFVNYHQFTTAHPDGKKNFGKPIKPDNRQKWRNSLSAGEVRRIEEIAYPTMLEFGYRTEFADRHRPIGHLERTLGVANDIYAALSVGNRFRRDNSFRRRLNRLGIALLYKLSQLPGGGLLRVRSQASSVGVGDPDADAGAVVPPPPRRPAK